jgi:hypothetical protein
MDKFPVDSYACHHSNPTTLTTNRPPSPFQGEGRGEVSIHATTDYAYELSGALPILISIINLVVQRPNPIAHPNMAL